MSHLTIKQCSEQCFVAHKEIKGYLHRRGFSPYPQGLCKIPNEIFFKIFYYLNYQDLKAVALTCKKWLILQNETFWESHCNANFVIRNSLWMDYGITWKAISSTLHGAIFQQPLEVSTVLLSDLGGAARKRLEWHRNDPYRVRNGSVATFLEEEKGLHIRISPTQKIIKKIDIRDPKPDSLMWDFQGNILVIIGHPRYYGQTSFNFRLNYLILWDLSINKEIGRKELQFPKYATLNSLAVEGEEIFIECLEYIQNKPNCTILKIAPKLYQDEKKT